MFIHLEPSPPSHQIDHNFSPCAQWKKPEFSQSEDMYRTVTQLWHCRRNNNHTFKAIPPGLALPVIWAGAFKYPNSWLSDAGKREKALCYRQIHSLHLGIRAKFPPKHLCVILSDQLLDSQLTSTLVQSSAKALVSKW